MANIKTKRNYQTWRDEFLKPLHKRGGKYNPPPRKSHQHHYDQTTKLYGRGG